jgi:hypothetical protein
MLRDILVETIGMEPDMNVVAEVADASSLTTPEWMAVEVVVIGKDDRPLASALLRQHPHLKIFAIANQGESSLFEMRPQRLSLGELSPQRLIEAIRKSSQEYANA